MNEIKTLKDLDCSLDLNCATLPYAVDISDLKAEAVNHINQFKKDLRMAELINNKEWIIERKAQIDYIIWNNNLTEEDFKDE